MKANAGIWIDLQRAILVSLVNSEPVLSHFDVGSPEPFPSTIESIAGHSYTRNDFQAENREDRKKLANRQRMYASIAAALSGIDSLLICGPGEAKLEFAKHLKSKRSSVSNLTVETSDKMTEPQFVAKVRQYFSTVLKP